MKETDEMSALMVKALMQCPKCGGKIKKNGGACCLTRNERFRVKEDAK